MVRRFFLISIVITLLSSCAFFGSSIFPQAMSENLGGLLSGNITKFYILNNDLGQEYLFLVVDNAGNINVAIFDLSLNLRGFLENGVNGVPPEFLCFFFKSIECGHLCKGFSLFG